MSCRSVLAEPVWRLPMANGAGYGDLRNDRPAPALPPGGKALRLQTLREARLQGLPLAAPRSGSDLGGTTVNCAEPVWRLPMANGAGYGDLRNDRPAPALPPGGKALRLQTLREARLQGLPLAAPRTGSTRSTVARYRRTSGDREVAR
jgi:hypothetical protein